MKEIWKDILRYEGKYQISNFGKVKSLARYRYGTGISAKERFYNERIMAYSKGGRGYFQVKLTNNIKISKTFTIHRMVAQAFVPNPFNKPQVNHIDGDKHNNMVENLEWVTASENVQHAVDIGLKSMDMFKKKILMLDKNNNKLLWFDSITEASEASGAWIANISHCCSGKRKTTGGYKWQYYYGN